MSSCNTKPDFSDLLSYIEDKALLQHLIDLTDPIVSFRYEKYENKEYLNKWKKEWQKIYVNKAVDGEQVATDWLIQLFNTLFAHQQVILVRSSGEPEYFPAHGNQPARIEFAHGFFASALHEISHWCMAGRTRRTLSDFGYWYAPDGRSATQQQAFEHVEIKPQALECLFTLACKNSFQVSQDNLFATFDTSGSTFANDVYMQVIEYIEKPHTLPRDAKVLLRTFLSVCTYS
ncbi:elongation factor P hydroxylase [Psychrobacter alimentarius]|uniref:elongation factor P hydroxylase n=1 Tax=Psychrobacter alimentarius TaxID=261164 RepID=UPI001918AF4D|nr:elongation factor P hydroxylase [Psychrobacter alimentarius]